MDAIKSNYNHTAMKKLIPILLATLPMTSCFGFYHRGPAHPFGFVFLILIIILMIVAFNRVSRNPDPYTRRRNRRILLIVLALLLIWPLIGFLLIPLMAVSLGLFFFFPPLLLIILIVVLLLRRRD
jgi:phosphatidylserine synthase